MLHRDEEPSPDSLTSLESLRFLGQISAHSGIVGE